ncbi:metallophosphoesterase family protein [Thermococcus celer]|uniref:Phosphoesterase n=1 Tax=Thermococcus celer Vu 13 = JCM 8558 TaxID=1293037 RepID=A0A218P3E3_THECE|nr:metallophosphoesterase [Thermococcus celer]ASI99451.1 phosphoesterase [Thermococcus celer] [Thermococcus celer Vu 13 = JCM 8558]
MKKKAISLFLLVLIVLAAGCVGSGGKTASTSPSATGTPTKSGGIDFSAYGNGEVLSNWYRLANASTVYASEGYEDLAKHYFPNARVLPASQYDGGIAILSPKDARPILRGKPILITVNDYFGYIAYKLGLKFVGEDKGVFAAFNEGGKAYLVFTGTGRAGVGAALEYAMELKKGKKVKVDDVVRSGEFEGVLIKVIGDNNWNGIQDKGEDWYLASFKTLEPFVYYWRVVDGENVTVKGGFIRLVNGSTVYIHALGFNVSVEIKNPNGATLTYVIENTNPSVLNLPAGAETGDTWVRLTTSKSSFGVTPKDVGDYTVLALGDHRPDGGKEVPPVFLKIRDAINADKGVFVIDGGDLVYSGRVDEWSELLKEWKWDKPIFISVGNHEYRGEGINVYHRFFGPMDYSFALGDYYYIFMDNVEHDYGLSDGQWSWLKDQLERAKATGKRPVIIMHTPPVDPRPNGDHSMNSRDGKRLLELMKEYNAFGIFSHIHIFWNGTVDGVHLIVTGGGGAPLYARPDEGGFYHYVRLGMGSSGSVTVEPIKVEP